ncbi:hypothetical protein D3C73_591800 [compost metagenome]
MHPRENLQVPGQQHSIDHLRHFGMAQATRAAFAVELLEHMAQAQFDRRTQAQRLGNVTRHFTMHLGLGRGLAHGTQPRRAQCLAEHRVAPGDVITEQAHEVLGVGGATGPTQQGHLPRHFDVFAGAVAGLRKPLGQPRGAA